MSVSDTSRPAAISGAPQPLTAILPNGRVVWLRVSPAIAPVGAVRDLRADAVHSIARRRAALVEQRAGLARLAGTAAADLRRLSESQLSASRRARRRLARGAARLDRRFVAARHTHALARGREARAVEEAISRGGRRALWDALLVASAAPLFSAYGQPGHLLGDANLALTASLLVWLLGDEIVDALFGAAGASAPGPRDTDIWSYLAPPGNVLTGYWLLSGRQHERFVTGLTPSLAFVERRGRRYTYAATVDLGPALAPDYVEDFRAKTAVPAIAVIREAVPSAIGESTRVRIVAVSARVDAGELTIEVTVRVTAPGPSRPPGPALFDRLAVAWMVDVLPSTPAE
jgi:hypothetical protein